MTPSKLALDLADDPLAEEAALVHLARTDRAAFGELYDRYVDAIYRYAFQRTSDHHAAQDVTAETFRRALEGLPRYRWQGRPFGAWLTRITANVLHERRRAQPGEEAFSALPEDGSPGDDTPAALETIVADEERAELWQLLARLSLDHQRVLVLRYARNLDYVEIAAQMGKTPAACKQLAYRALKALRAAVLASDMWRERGPHHDKTTH